jgi:hypothetical protein
MDINNPGCGCLVSVAQRELGAFMRVVMDLYGSEEAELSAGGWLDELESIDVSTELTSRTFRQLTIAAAARLAKRQLVTAQPSLEILLPGEFLRSTDMQWRSRSAAAICRNVSR